MLFHSFHTFFPLVIIMLCSLYQGMIMQRVILKRWSIALAACLSTYLAWILITAHPFSHTAANLGRHLTFSPETISIFSGSIFGMEILVALILAFFTFVIPWAYRGE